MVKKLIKLDRLKRSLEHTKKKAEVMKDVEHNKNSTLYCHTSVRIY